MLYLGLQSDERSDVISKRHPRDRPGQGEHQEDQQREGLFLFISLIPVFIFLLLLIIIITSKYPQISPTILTSPLTLQLTPYQDSSLTCCRVCYPPGPVQGGGGQWNRCHGYTRDGEGPQEPGEHQLCETHTTTHTHTITRAYNQGRTQSNRCTLTQPHRSATTHTLSRFVWMND